MYYILLMIVIIFLLYFYTMKVVECYQIKYMYDRTNEVNNTLIKISEELDSYQDINMLYKHMLEETINLIETADCGSILIYNIERDCMEYVAATEFDLGELKKVSLRKEELFLYKTTRLKTPDIIKNPLLFDMDNISEDKFNSLRSTNALDIRSTLSSPLYINGEFYGIINVDSKKNENAFTKNDIRLIQYICRQLEAAIKNVLLMNSLIEITRIDKLTDVYNRRYFEEIMETELKRAERYDNDFSLVMIDMDDFKMVNDNYGHNMGDDILRYFVDALKQNIRSTDIIARFAGDEFIVVMHNSDVNQTLRRIEKLREYFKEHPYCNISVEFSAGVCRYKKGASLDEMIIIADNNMYDEKRRRKKNAGSCLSH